MILRIKQLILIIIVIVWLLAVWSLLPIPLELRIAACDVGQGDAILIRYGQRHILIDAGRNNAVLDCLRQEIFWGNKTIDVAVITHWDEDHIGGFPAVLEQYQVANWIFNPTVADSKIAQNLFSQIKTTTFQPVSGDEMVFPGMRLRVLWSEQNRVTPQDSRGSDQNHDSVAVVIQTESFGFFGTGDLECPEQLAITMSGLLNQPAILKIAHHGAKSATCSELLESLRPEVAIISVGEGNSYGHPHPETIQSLHSFGVFLKRTDQIGKIVVEWLPNWSGFRFQNLP